MEESTSPIQFFAEDIEFELPTPMHYVHWIEQAVQSNNYEVSEINYIFCTDEYLYSINVSYLDHDTYTDIITFDNSEEEGLIESDIFISIERVQENAKAFNVSFEEELKRVMIHGVLHLVGYQDKSPADQQEMRDQENHWVQAFAAM